MRKIVGILIFLAAGAPLLAATPAPPAQIFSYRKNFIVVSSDPAAASWIAREAERLRGEILREFQWKQRWKASVVLEMEFAGEDRAREEICSAVVRKIFRHPPLWLQCGLERYFSDRRDFHPALLREIKTAGQWLDLDTLLGRTIPFDNARWQDVFARESAGLVFFMHKKNPELLLAYRKGKGNAQAVGALGNAWLQWIDAAPVLLPVPNAPSPGVSSADFLNRQLARVLRVRVRDDKGEILGADSAMHVPALEPCCQRDIARRKLLAGYGEFVRLARLDEKKATLAQSYVDCANLVLQRKDFYEMFVALEKQRLAHTVDQR